MMVADKMSYSSYRPIGPILPILPIFPILSWVLFLIPVHIEGGTKKGID